MLEPGGCTQQWQFIPFTSACSSSGSCFQQNWGQRPAAVFPGTNTHWCLFLTVLHLVLFYENRLQDHHLVIPSVLQGLRALVSLCPAAHSAGIHSKNGAGEVQHLSTGWSSTSSRAQLGCQLLPGGITLSPPCSCCASCRGAGERTLP